MSLLLFYLTVFSLEHVGPRSHRAAPCYTPAIFIFCLDQALSELFFLPKTDDLLDGTVKNTGRLLRMLPVIFREFSRALSRFSRVVIGLFVHISSSEDIMFFHQKCSKIHYFLPQL